ncbi:dsDNA nuclease domain-containing protein [Bacillus sp. FSL K6-3431]|uniref:dsDNA nuclease domain-containing protein n=1 Tax=Bacillus sp. FSL K6-3431 TaxID=2921500 RepID=UPI0030F5A7C0
MKIIEHIIESRLNSTEEIDDERERHFTQINNKTSSEIATYLTNIPPGEIGGLTALSGFYYQFLVTIEYIIEMLEGKWDYVIMEGHDDVVVGKNNKIRFIQVKTSGKVKLNVTESPASALYSRGTKTISGTSFKRNNSWVDKLLSNAELAPKSEGFITEFQLYASYHFTKTENYNFDIYTDNKNYDKDITNKDDLFKKIVVPSFTIKGEPYVYEERCGETLNKLLSRLFIRPGISLSDIDIYKNHLCMRLNNYLFKDIGDNITMKVEDLHMLIGELFTNCTYKGNQKILMITEESVERILSGIRAKSIEKASTSAEKHDSGRVINKVIEELLNEFEDFEHAGFIQDKIYTYRDYILSWISNGGNIRQLLERYIDGTTKTQIYAKIRDLDRLNRLKELYCSIIILFIGRDSLIKFADNNGILSKQCETTNEIISFLSLEKKRKLADGLEKLESIIYNSEVDEQLFLLDKKLHVIIQNYNDRDFNVSKEHEINLRQDTSITEFEVYSKLNQVPLIANIIPGNMLNADFLEAIDIDDDIQSSLQDIWAKYQRGEV